MRDARPEPSAPFVAAIAARMESRRTASTRRRTRVAVAVVLTAAMAAVIGATGGFSSAANSIENAAGSVAGAGTTDSVSPASTPGTFTGGSLPGFDPSCDMYAQAPTISSVSPLMGAPGDLVTVAGTNFTGINEVTSVQLNGVDASFRIDSSTQLEFVVPDNGTSGTVTIANCAGPATSTDSVTVEQGPAITDVSPASGGIGSAVTITGTGFTGTTSVTFNGKADTTFSVVGDTTINAHVPIGAPVKLGTVNVTNGVSTASSPFQVESGAPTITSIAPASGQVGQAQAIVIKGSGFMDSTAHALVTNVYFSGDPNPVAATFTVMSKSEVDATTVPTGAITGPVTVVTSLGSTTSKQTFTVVAATPVVSSFNPSFGAVGSTIKIVGSSLIGVTGVNFTDGGGDQTIAGTSVKVVNDSTVSVKVPTGAQTGPVEVVRPNGDTPQTGTSSTDFTVVSEAPQIDSVTPGSGGYGTQVEIDAAAGKSLIGVTSVTFNGTADKTFTVATNGSSITATVPPKAPAKAIGAGTIAVKNAKGTSTVPFDVISFGPTITRVIGTLGNGSQAQVGDPITIQGTNLDSVTSVKFTGGHSSSTFLWQDDTLLTVRVPAGADTGPVTAINPDGAATSASSLTILKQPTIVGFSPAFGRSGTKVTIVGDGFDGTSAVYFGGAPAKFAENKDGSLTATVPSNASTGSVEVVVGRVMSADSGNDVFTIVATKPTVSSFSPDSGTVGTTITIGGKRFIGPVTVKFGSKTATAVHVTSSTSLTAKVPAGATGTVTVSVSNLAGAGTKSGFQVIAPLHASPAAGVAGTTRVTITGSNLNARGTPTVRFDGTAVPAGDVVSSSATRIVVKVPVGASTGSITVTTGSATATTPGTFTVIVQPVLHAFPSGARVGTTISITGSGFTGVNSVKFGTHSASFTVVNDGLIHARVPRSGNGHITVHNAAGSATSAGSFSAVR